MELLKLLAVFAVIIGTVVGLKWKVYWSMAAAGAVAIVLFRLPADVILNCFKAGLTGKLTFQSLAILFALTYLQQMMNKRQNLSNAQVATNGLFHNNRINASVVPFILGMLPSAPTVVICGPIVRAAIGDELSTEEKAACTTYYRHISEAFFPTYTNIFIAIGLTAGRVTSASFIIGMLPLILALFGIGHLFYLRKVPKQAAGADMTNDQPKSYYWKLLIKSLWPIALTIGLILGLNLQVYVAVAITIVLNIFIGKFNLDELKSFVIPSINWFNIKSIIAGMIFKEILSATGAIALLPEAFAALPIPWWAVYGLMFFFGSFVGGQTLNLICMPTIMATLPAGHSGLAIFILIMATEYAVSQFNPTHVCITLCANDYEVPLGKVIAKVFPMVATFFVVLYAYFLLLNGLGF